MCELVSLISLCNCLLARRQEKKTQVLLLIYFCLDCVKLKHYLVSVQVLTYIKVSLFDLYIGSITKAAVLFLSSLKY